MPTLLHRILGRVTTRHLLAIDVGSNTAIRALLFDEEGGTYRALDRYSSELPYRENDSAFIRLLEERLHRVLAGYIRRIGRVPDAGLIGLGSHLTVSEIVIANRNRPDPDAPLRYRELGETMAEFLRHHRVRRIGERSYALAHLTPLGVRVDGYPVEELSHRTRGRQIEIRVFTTYALEEYWRAIWRLRTLFGGIPLTGVSNQAAVAAALVAGLGAKEALALKIGAKTTEVSAIGNGEMIAAGQYNIGGDNITSAIAERLNVRRQDAERLKCQWDSVSIPARLRTAAEGAIQTAGKQWLHGLADTLRKNVLAAVPERIYIFGGGARLTAIRQALELQPWREGIALGERLDIRRLDAEEIAGRIFGNSRPPLAGPEETPLAALAFRLAQSA